MERCLKIWGIAFEVTELSRLECLLFHVPCGVEHKAMGVKQRIWFPIDGSCRFVNELCPHQIARRAISFDAMFTNPCFGFLLNFSHGLIDAVAESVENAFVFPERICERDSLGQVEVEIIAHSSIAVGAQRQLVSGSRVKIIAQPIKTQLFHIACEAQHLRRPSSPATCQFLTFAEIVRMCVVALR